MATRDALTRSRMGGLAVLVVLSSCLTASPVVAQPSVGVSVEVFDNTLAPYGDWVAVGRFGRAWRPYRSVVGIDFRPYLSGGHWVYTDYGWTFESDYEWGWAPFHYGRWFLDDYYGWVWVPDTVWGPAWVDWRFGGGYVGWVPLAPVGFSIGYGFYRPAWCFVPARHFVVRDVYHYALPVDRFHWAYSVTSPVQQPIHHAGAQWNAGPPPGQVSQAVGHPIQPVSITPPPPGRVQPVSAARPSGLAAHGVLPPASSPNSPPAGSAPHPTAIAAPSSGAPTPHPTPPPPSEPRWGTAPPGGSAHWGRGGENTPSSPPGHPTPVPNSPPPMQSSPHPWVAPPGASSPAPRPSTEAHWGQTPPNVAPHWTGGSASAQPAPTPPTGNVHSGGFVPQAAPAPVPSSGHPSSGGFVSPAPAPGGRHPVSPAPRPAPAPAPASVHPVAPAPRPAPAPATPSGFAPSPPSGKQGFYSPRINQSAPPMRAAPAPANFGRSFGGFSRPSAPMASRPAPAPRTFASIRHR
jgi:hypothetical protein